MMETIAAVVIFGFLGAALLGCVIAFVVHMANLHRLDNSGGYWTSVNRRRFQKGMIPNKHTREYAPENKNWWM